MTPLDSLILSRLTDQLDSRDGRVRRHAGTEICRLLGVTDAMAVMEAVPPEWPAMDWTLVGGWHEGDVRGVTVAVRTLLGSALEERVRVVLGGDVGEAVERARDGLRRRVQGMVVA